MKSTSCAVAASVLLGLASPAHAARLDLDLARFVTAKEAQARELAETLTNKVPGFVWSFFDAVQKDDWETATNLAARIDKASGRYGTQDKEPLSPALQSAIWPAISEIIGAYGDFHAWDNKWLHRFGSEIITAIPRGSIYFGGTDPGRFIISALSGSHREGRPFFTLTQNQLADGTYLDYLRKMYGSKIYIPTQEDSQKCFQEYLADAQDRLKAGKLKPGEDVRIVENRVQVSGQVAVMQINGLLAKIIVEKNPDREVYVEESFTLDWMYPHLSPHGLIFELHRKPLTQLREEIVRKDGEYWNRLVSELIGDWLSDKTSVKEICDFADRILGQKNFDGFKGDKGFARNDDARKTFSKLRSAIAGVYVWRASNSNEQVEKVRMQRAAESALRQAFALCPYSPEAVFRYCSFLTERKRTDDAILIAKAALRLNEDDPAFRDLLRSLYKAQ